MPWLTTRRGILAGAALAAAVPAVPRTGLAGIFEAGEEYFAGYEPLDDGPYHIAGIRPGEVDAELLRQVVGFDASVRPGGIIVDTAGRWLYLPIGGGEAVRYGIGVGREGLEWSGRATIDRKAAWPRWTPTASMIRREPRYAAWAEGMEGGLGNPLGARALYLYENGRDTMYRLHGTNEPESIGQAVSSGCVRLLNHDVIDLHARVPIGAPITVLA